MFAFGTFPLPSEPSPSTGYDRVGLDPPLFTQPIEDCSVDEGNDITLHGVLTGSQPIRVSWLHNGELGEIYTHNSQVLLSVMFDL